ncbi:hypothetical protein [uncultured Winogradskyella sp.]|uniref:hypothetical protein n=1 Tax=uncultured Winogradskyella sp. TaxID=395353 RepID=UPI00263591CB|nr:hypothetical protein [uncultured Winogradskyella sp.]
MEKLLSKADIQDILENNPDNPVFKYYGVRLMGTEKHSYKEVLAVSDKNNLILIKGNKDTGNIHIKERHNFWSTKNYIVKNPKGEIVFQDQSRFPKDVAPIKFMKIADEIYSDENLIIDNPHPMANLFDLYIGEYQFDKPQKVKLLLYKGTKIIHSLFLARSTYNKKRVSKFPFSRGTVEFRYNPETGTNDTLIPYFDTRPKPRYCLVIEKHPKEDLENILLIVYKSDEPEKHYLKKIGKRKLIKFETKKHEEVSYQHGDLRPLEKIIIETDNDIKTGKINLND